MDTQKVGMAIGMGALFSAGTAVGAGLCALANKVHYLSLVRSSLPVAITGGISAMVVAGICQTDCKNDTKLAAIIAGIAMTMFSSPHLGKYLQGNRLSYLESAALTATSLGTNLAVFVGCLFTNSAYDDLKWRRLSREAQEK